MTTAGGRDRDDDALAAEYAVGVLPYAERVAFARRLENEPELADKVRFWDEQLSPMTEQAGEVAPPDHVLARLEANLFEPAAQPRGWWQSLPFWRGLSFASLAALAVVVLLYAGYIRGPLSGPAQPFLVAELAGDTGAVRVLTFFDPRESVLKISRVAGEPAPGRDFELWLIEADKAPVSMGVMPRDATGTMRVSAEHRALIANAILAISDEPAGGSPTGTATGAVLALGKVTPI
ncbi:MAG: anti-sigma factor [Rhizobiaceae bacterium]